MSEGPRVAVVLPARNASATIGVQLRALSTQVGPFHLVVVDSASTDDTAAVAESFRDVFDRIDVVTASRPGAATARNLGVAATDAELIAFCDADDQVRDGWLQALVEGLTDAEIAAGHMDFDDVNEEATRIRAGVVDRVEHGSPTVAFTKVVAASAAVRRRLFDDMGGFDERFDGIGNEEGELFFRLQRGGGRVADCPRAVVAYRLRPSAWSECKQSWRNGRGVGVMYRWHGVRALDSGIDPSRALPTLWWCLPRVPWLVAGGSARRGVWLRTVCRSLGFVVGFHIDARRRARWHRHPLWVDPARNASKGSHV